MTFFVGAQRVVRIFRGSVSVARAYRGSALVFERSVSEDLATSKGTAELSERDTGLSSANDG